MLAHLASNIVGHSEGALPEAIKSDASREILRAKEALQDDRRLEAFPKCIMQQKSQHSQVTPPSTCKSAVALGRVPKHRFETSCHLH